MIDIDKYEGHTPVWYLHGETGAWWVQSDFTTHDDFVVAEVRSQNEVDAQLIADAPKLLAEIKRLRKEINQLPIDLHESLDMILEAYHPEVRESVMSMFGYAWGNNLTGYEE
tara:strand:- start:42 stop:377 length:336 start_codon:yes stop_codon:yes gene_type:complete